MNYYENPAFDAARANWGGLWKLPDKSHFEELVNKCKWSWEPMNGVQGYKVTGPNGNSIFLPVGNYWSMCNESTYSKEDAYCLQVSKSSYSIVKKERYLGHLIRPVVE